MTPQQRLAVAQIARQWIGTKFFPHAAKKGVGADCVNMALTIYQEAGCLPPDIKFPAYTMDGGDHAESSKILDWLGATAFFQAAPGLPQVGDLLVLKIGKVAYHVGVMCGPTTFVHALRHYGVTEGDLRDSTWSTRLCSTWNIK